MHLNYTRIIQKNFLHMASSHHTKPKLDGFDKAFIKVLFELQKIGFCKNVAQIEEYLSIPKRTLYQVINGSRGIPLIHRHKIQKLFTDNYRVNPRVFVNTTAAIFDGPVPTLSDITEPFVNKSDSDKRWTMGDSLELERFRKDAEVKDEQIKELKKEVKFWRDLAQKGIMAQQNAAGTKTKSGHKSGQ
jgi:hypothetical protein